MMMMMMVLFVLFLLMSDARVNDIVDIDVDDVKNE
jgi:hypothetical protein